MAPVLSRCTALVAVAALAASLSACGSSTRGAGSVLAPSTAAIGPTSAPSSSSVAGHSAVPRPSHAATTASRASEPPRTSQPRTGGAPPSPHGPAVLTRLPLPYATGNATEVITATAPSMGSTTGTLRTWQRVSGGWTQLGPAVSAEFGSQGLTDHMSEQISATPVGSFTLTQAFGHDTNPGTPLPYFQTDAADWWISKTTGADAALYNTHQRCTNSSCPFTPAAPNEQLATSLPYYNYAVVIDYNTSDAPGGVHLGAGSAVFLHVSVGSPTAGCVAIDQSRLVSIMQWLRPSAHPRILIGVG